LHLILLRLAEDTERSQELRMKVRAALSYPLMVLGVALVLAILAQNFIFRDFLANLASLGVPLPWTTQVLMLSCNLVSQPAAWLALLLGGGLFGFLCVKVRAFERLRPFLFLIPGLGRVLRTVLAVEFVRALARCQTAGVPLLAAVQLASELDPQLRRIGEDMKTRLTAGEPFHEVMEASGFFPRAFAMVLQAGEESGRLADLLVQVAQISEESLESGIQAASDLLQPLLLLAVGGLVGFMVIATMSPMLKLVERL
jgi:type II secretory pathway component PulF